MSYLNFDLERFGKQIPITFFHLLITLWWNSTRECNHLLVWVILSFSFSSSKIEEGACFVKNMWEKAGWIGGVGTFYGPDGLGIITVLYDTYTWKCCSLSEIFCLLRNNNCSKCIWANSPTYSLLCGFICKCINSYTCMDFHVTGTVHKSEISHPVFWHIRTSGMLMVSCVYFFENFSQSDVWFCRF